MRSCARDTLAMLATTGQSEDGSPTWRAPVGGPLVLELCHRPFIRHNVRYWHKADMPSATVRYGGKADIDRARRNIRPRFAAAPIAAACLALAFGILEGESSQHTLL